MWSFDYTFIQRALILSYLFLAGYRNIGDLKDMRLVDL